MLHKIFFDENGIVNEILKGIISREREKVQRNPFLQPIEAEIERLENIDKQIKARLEAMKHLHRWISEIFTPPQLDKDKSEKSQPENNIEKEKPIKYDETSEKIDDGFEESLSEPMSHRLKVLEQAVKDVVAKLGKADMTTRFNQINEIYQKLEKCVNCPEEQKETVKYLVDVEAAVGDALNFLSTSKVGTRFNLLKELRQELEQAIENSRNNNFSPEPQQV
jgi:hypothetical protein